MAKNGANASHHPLTNELSYITAGEKEQLVNKRLIQAQQIKGGLTVPGPGQCKCNLFDKSTREVPGTDWDNE